LANSALTVPRVGAAASGRARPRPVPVSRHRTRPPDPRCSQAASHRSEDRRLPQLRRATSPRPSASSAGKCAMRCIGSSTPCASTSPAQGPEAESRPTPDGLTRRSAPCPPCSTNRSCSFCARGFAATCSPRVTPPTTCLDAPRLDGGVLGGAAPLQRAWRIRQLPDWTRVRTGSVRRIAATTTASPA
jgi:hypothetical protein